MQLVRAVIHQSIFPQHCATTPKLPEFERSDRNVFGENRNNPFSEAGPRSYRLDFAVILTNWFVASVLGEQTKGPLGCFEPFVQLQYGGRIVM